jgi:hypothetical protein
MSYSQAIKNPQCKAGYKRISGKRGIKGGSLIDLMNKRILVLLVLLVYLLLRPFIFTREIIFLK